LREPLTDIIESEDKVRVIVELPGVEKKEIKVNASDRALDIGVENPDKPFIKHLDLPCDVRRDSAKANYKNGVLEVVLTRVAPKKRSKAIKVE
jgi:HSP20 family protein